MLRGNVNNFVCSFSECYLDDDFLNVPSKEKRQHSQVFME